MIDFRYHLVSLVAVFMALAVGIVLGAGPLGQEISSTLESQVKDLREERNDLRAQLDQAHAREEAKTEVITTLTPTVTANQLVGRRVAVLTFPGADRNIVGQLQDQVAAAGGQVVQTVRLTDSWSDPETAATRHEVAAELAATLDDPQPREGAEPTTETVLAAALSGREAVLGAGDWRTATDRLAELDLLDTNWADSEDDLTADAPDSFIIVTGDLTTVQVDEDEAGDPRLQQSLDLIAAFGTLGVPTVVAGHGTESYGDPVQAAESPVVRGVRAESAIAESVSSVDNVEGPTGQLSVVFGLRWATEGQYGHWGLGTDAEAPSPPVPQPVIPDPIEAEPEGGDPGPPLPEDEAEQTSGPEGPLAPEGDGASTDTDLVTEAPTP